eukprot:5913760-Prymnesium_polylepis.1
MIGNQVRVLTVQIADLGADLPGQRLTCQVRGGQRGRERQGHARNLSALRPLEVPLCPRAAEAVAARPLAPYADGRR